MIELKPCPFCGGDAHTGDSENIPPFARCQNCYTWMFANTELGASDKWNTRPIEDALRAEMEVVHAAAMRDANLLLAIDAENKRLKAELAALREAQRWLPVLEGLPEIWDRVIVWDSWTKAEYYARVDYDGIWHGEDYGLGDIEVTHWRPLPEQPTEEVRNE